MNYVPEQSETRHSKNAVRVAINVLIRKISSSKKAHLSGNPLFYRLLTINAWSEPLIAILLFNNSRMLTSTAATVN